MNIFSRAAAGAWHGIQSAGAAVVRTIENNPVLQADVKGVQSSVAQTVQDVGAGATTRVTAAVGAGSGRSTPVTLPVTQRQLIIAGAIALVSIVLVFLVARHHGASAASA